MVPRSPACTTPVQLTLPFIDSHVNREMLLKGVMAYEINQYQSHMFANSYRFQLANDSDEEEEPEIEAPLMPSKSKKRKSVSGAPADAELSKNQALLAEGKKELAAAKAEWKKHKAAEEAKLAKDWKELNTAKKLFEEAKIAFQLEKAAFEKQKVAVGLASVTSSAQKTPAVAKVANKPLSDESAIGQLKLRAGTSTATEKKPAAKTGKPSKQSKPSQQEQEVLDQDEYYVEAIREHHWDDKAGTFKFLVKWWDFDESSNTWEPLKNMDLDAIKDYIKDKMAMRVEVGKDGPVLVPLDLKVGQQTTTVTVAPAVAPACHHDPGLNKGAL